MTERIIPEVANLNVQLRYTFAHFLSCGAFAVECEATALGFCSEVSANDEVVFARRGSEFNLDITLCMTVLDECANVCCPSKYLQESM